jgi:hypothetical protein
METSEDAAMLQQLAKDGKLRTHAFTDREQLLKLSEPVKRAYVGELHAEAVYERINAIP